MRKFVEPYRVNIKDSKATNVMTQGKWYINDECKVFGPMSWKQVKAKVDSARVTPHAQIKEETWPTWVSIWYYFRPKTGSEIEIEGILPSRYDALLYFGIFLFMAGVFVFMLEPMFGLVLLIISPVIEGFAIQQEREHKPKALSSTIGNIMAGCWIVVQILVTGLLLTTII